MRNRFARSPQQAEIAALRSRVRQLSGALALGASMIGNPQLDQHPERFRRRMERTRDYLAMMSRAGRC